MTRPKQQGTRIERPTMAEMGDAPLHNGISQVKAALVNKHRRQPRIMVMHKGSLENNVFRMEIPIEARAASMGTMFWYCYCKQ